MLSDLLLRPAPGSDCPCSMHHPTGFDAPSTRKVMPITLKNNRLFPVLMLIGLIVFVSCKEQNKAENRIPVNQSSVNSVKRPLDFGTRVVGNLSKNITGVFEDKKGNYWFTSQGDGIYRYDGKTLIQLTARDGLCGNSVSSIQEDSVGNLWFTTSEGICNWNHVAFNNFTLALKSTTKEDLQKKSNGLFFIFEGSAYQYDGKTFSKFPIHPADYQQSLTNLDRPYGLYCIVKDSSGHLWFGTDQRGVCHYDGKTFTYITEKGLEKAAVRAIFQDSNGTMWFGNNGHGLFRYKNEKLTNVTDENGLGNPDFLKRNSSAKSTKNLARVWTINEDKSGVIWIGTIDSGVWSYDGKEFKNFSIQDGLPNNQTSSISKDKDGNLWFVSENEGLSKFNGGAFERFDFPPK